MAQPIRLDRLTAGRSAGFEQPFEMLTACHERVHRMLTLLQRLRAHVREHGVDRQARDAAQDVLRYFDQAAPQHHRDEELHVFPPLLAKGDPAVAAVVHRLQQDHVAMEARWLTARQVLEGLQSATAQPFDAPAEAALDAFASLYDTHIATEEKIAYPLASALLTPQAITAMGEEMMRRRGVGS